MAGGGGPLGRDRRDLLAHRKHLRGAAADVLEEGVQRAEPLISRRNALAATVFEVSQEALHPIESEILELDSGELAALVRGDEHEEQTHSVAVALHRRTPKSLLPGEMTDEEGVKKRSESGRAHDATSGIAVAATRAKRFLASRRSSQAIVR